MVGVDGSSPFAPTNLLKRLLIFQLYKQPESQVTRKIAYTQNFLNVLNPATKSLGMQKPVITGIFSAKK